MSTSDAWLLECGESLKIAVGDHEMIELVQTGQPDQLSAMTGQNGEVLQWQDSQVPVIDIATLHAGTQQAWPDSYLCLLNYQASPGGPLQQMALRVRQAPERILVDDAQVCELPREYDDSPLKAVTLSCFTHHAEPVLIVDISRLCSDDFRAQASGQ